MTYVGLSGIPTHLRYEKVHAERRTFVFQVTLKLVDRLFEHLGTLADTTYDANTTYILMSLNIRYTAKSTLRHLHL